MSFHIFLENAGHPRSPIKYATTNTLSSYLNKHSSCLVQLQSSMTKNCHLLSPCLVTDTVKGTFIHLFINPRPPNLVTIFPVTVPAPERGVCSWASHLMRLRRILLPLRWETTVSTFPPYMVAVQMRNQHM